jgi:hypothetical protein
MVRLEIVGLGKLRLVLEDLTELSQSKVEGEYNYALNNLLFSVVYRGRHLSGHLLNPSEMNLWRPLLSFDLY